MPVLGSQALVYWKGSYHVASAGLFLLEGVCVCAVGNRGEASCGLASSCWGWPSCSLQKLPFELKVSILAMQESAPCGFIAALPLSGVLHGCQERVEQRASVAIVVGENQCNVNRKSGLHFSPLSTAAENHTNQAEVTAVCTV